MGYSAAEIERYVYCPLSWWLSRGGVEGRGRAIEEGVAKHAAKGQWLARWQRTLREHRKAFETAIHLAMVAAAAMTLAIEVTFLDFTGLYNRVLLLLGLFWLFVALTFLVRALRTQDEARRVAYTAGIVTGDVTYSDLDRPGEVLRCDKYELSGKPDYIVRRAGALVPVEVKTGKSPQEPHESHVLQLGAYCILVEENFKERVPYGVISYEERAFEIPFTENLRDRVLETVLRMKLADVTGVVHRNHERAGKCRTCSRRDACAERIA